MALFGKKTTKTEKAPKVVAKKATVKAPKVAKPAKKAVAVSAQKLSTTAATDCILRPHITEKAGLQNEKANVYTFQIAKTATKHTVAKAIESLYKVSPVKVNIVNLPVKRVLVRGKKGSQSAIKKALVYLKKGDTIELA